MRRLLSVLVGVLLTAATAAAAGVSNVAFRDPKPLRYWPTRTDYRFINCPEKTVRYEAEKGAQALILDCPVGDCVLGRNEARPVLRYAGRGEARRAEYRVALSVLEKGAAPRRCAEATVTATDDPAGVEVPLAYTIERPGEDQSVLVEVFPVKADKAEVRCQVPCPLAYLGRVMVTRPTFWTSDASARAWIALNLDAARLRSWKARAILRAEGGREVWSHTFDELRGRLV
jgi:hypothetical protein